MLQLIEIERYIAVPINQWTNMDQIRYAWGGRTHAFLADELYAQANPSKWGITKKFAAKYNCRYREEYCGRVLTYLIYLIVLDMIETSSTFEFPLLGKNNAYMYVKCIQGEDFKKALMRGAFQGIDFIASEFKAYRLHFQWTRGHKIREKPFYINARIRDWFYDKINHGKQYY